MAEYRLLPWILEQAEGQFRPLDWRWKPNDLLWISQVNALLQDVAKKYERLSAARGEMETLDRANKYIAYLIRMRVYLRQASFAWKADHLTFVRSVAGFYNDYGAILRLLKEDTGRGKLTPTD